MRKPSIILAAVLVAGGGFALAQDRPRAIGSLTFGEGDNFIIVGFNAHEDVADQPARGDVTYTQKTDGENVYFLLNVTCVEVRCNAATFSGQVYETNDGRFTDKGVQFWVEDGGLPGRENDRLAWKVFDWPGCLPFGREAPGELWQAPSAGNATVDDLLGDLNCDGWANFADINPFVLALSDPDAYAAQFPGCDALSADVNCDGKVNFADINPFVEELSRN